MSKVATHVTGIGDRVREAREDHGWNQSELARRADMRPNNINRIEAGQRCNISVDVLVRLATALEVTSDWLLGLRQPHSNE